MCRKRKIRYRNCVERETQNTDNVYIINESTPTFNMCDFTHSHSLKI